MCVCVCVCVCEESLTTVSAQRLVSCHSEPEAAPPAPAGSIRRTNRGMRREALKPAAAPATSCSELPAVKSRDKTFCLTLAERRLLLLQLQVQKEVQKEGESRCLCMRAAVCVSVCV